MSIVRITGVGKDLIEVEVHGGSGRLRFASGAGPLPDTQVGAFVVDGEPVALSLHGASAEGVLVLPQEAGSVLAAVAPAVSLSESNVLALAPLLEDLGDGLYTLSQGSGDPVKTVTPGFTAGGEGGAFLELDIAPRDGATVFARVGKVDVVLAGRTALKSGPPYWRLDANVILDLPGFEVRVHDRGAREAFARSPLGVLDDAALRDAVAHLRSVDPNVALGPFTEDRIEPAAQQARALVWDLRAEDGIDEVSDTWRERAGAATEFRSRAKVNGVTFEVAFASQDGRHVDEVIVRSGTRFRATGLRPAARALARTLRQLAEEGG